MSEVDNSDLAELERQQEAKRGKEPIAQEEESEASDELALLQELSSHLRDTWVLLEFLSNEKFCKNITKRERDAINKHLERVYKLEAKVDEIIEDLEDDEDEDE